MRDRQDDSTYKAPRAELSLATDFELRSRLGDGSYSTVFRALYKGDGKEYAIKVIDKYHVMRHKMVDYVKRERDVLDRLNHDGVARLHFTFQDKINLYMALELCPNGELLEQITQHTHFSREVLKRNVFQQRGNRMDLETTRFYAAEVVDILEYLRANVVIHRDIKPENLMLNERGHLKLIDFGSVRDLSAVVPGAASPPQEDSSSGSGARAGDASRPERRLSFIGTADYIAPEVLSPGEASYALDLWALGCVIYQMMVGRPPFRAATEFLTFQRIKECSPVYPDHIPDVAKDIISKLLVEEPAARLGANDLEELKCHPFFSGIDWNGLRQGDAPDVLGNPGQIAEGAKHDWEMLSLLKALPTDVGEDHPSPSSSRQ